MPHHINAFFGFTPVMVEIHAVDARDRVQQVRDRLENLGRLVVDTCHSELSPDPHRLQHHYILMVMSLEPESQINSVMDQIDQILQDTAL